MATGYKYWLSRLLSRIGDRPAGIRRSRRLPRQRARASQSEFTIPAMVEGLESRQLLSGPTVNIGADFQANYNLTLNGTAHIPLGAGDFSLASVTLPGGSSAVSLPFAYCIDIGTSITPSTNYNVIVNSSNFAAPSAGYNQDPHVTGVADINTNAIAWLAANIGPTVGDPQSSGPVSDPGSHYAAGMAMQVALWEAEYEAPSASGWVSSINSSGDYLTGTHFSLMSVVPKAFNTTTAMTNQTIADFKADYAADMTALNAAYTGGLLATITPGVMFINPYVGSTYSSASAHQTLISYSSPTLSTTPNAPAANLGSPLSDTATLADGFGNAETGTITFTLVAPDHTVVYTDVVSVSGDGNYSTDNNGTGSAVANEAGTYQWNATYSGDTYNATVTDNGNANERTSVAVNSPGIVSGSTARITDSNGVSPAVTNVTLGPGMTVLIKDSATLSGGYNETGTITFNLYLGANLVDTETASVNGDGTYNTPTGYTLPTTGTVIGTYQWDASYSGDNNNSPIAEINQANEQTVVSPASPTITTTPNVTTITLGTSTPPVLTDTAVLTGGYFETGTITFTLYNGATLVDTETVAVSSDGSYTVPTGYTLPTTGTVAGTYQWDASYSGDGNNNAVADSGNANEQVAVSAATLTINTTPSVTTVTLGPSTPPVLKDTAVLAGGYHDTGTITFTLYNGANLVDTETVTVTGDGSYTTPGYTLPTTGTVAGTYQWDASYSGDANNNAVAESGNSNEQVTVSPGSPTISTTPNQTNVPLGTASVLLDTATLTGGYHEQGTITFTLYHGANVVDSETVAVNGDGTYSTPTGYTLPVNGSEGGLYQWTAVYSGDANNQNYTDAGGDVFTTLHVGAVYGGPYAFTLGSKTYTKYGAGDFSANTLAGHPESFMYCLDIVSTISLNTTYPVEVNSIGNDLNINHPGGLPAATARELAYLVANVATQPGVDTTAMQLALWSVEYGSQFTVTPGSESTAIINDMNAYITVALANANTPIAGGVLFINPFTGTQASPRYNVQTQITFDTTFDAGEQVNVPLAAPTIAATAGSAVTIGDGNAMTDTAVVANGYNATGSLTFKLYNTKNVLVYTDVVTVSDNGTYSTATGNNSGGYTPKVTDIEGLYTWKVAYTGDGNNAAATDGGGTGAGELVGASNIQAGDTAAIKFWNGTDGQALINSLNGSSSSTALAQWLGTTFPNLYGSGAGAYSMYKSGSWLTNTQVAAKYQSSTFYLASGTKTYAQVLASALAVYVTDEALNTDATSQAMATSDGFIESANGIGGADYQLGANGSVFGAANNTEQTVMYLLSYLNANSAGGIMMGNNATKLNAIYSVFSGIDITGQDATTASDS